MKHLELFIYGCLLAMLGTSCRKQEFTLPAEGVQVPYTDTVKTSLKEVLEKSAAKLFYQAWKRSSMESRLNTVSNPKNTFTILVPSDAAMEGAGFTAQKIQNMEVKDLDSLMMFYTLPGRITKEDMESKTENYVAASMLTKPGIRFRVTRAGGQHESDIVPYFYQQSLQIKGGKTYVNGKVAGSGKFIPAKDGYLWLLDQMVTKPNISVLDKLKEDGHFTMLLDILQYTDEQYAQLVEDGGIWNDYRQNFVKRYSWGIKPSEPWDNFSENLIRTTALLPPDDVFRKAGFNSVEDLKEFNIKRGLPHIEQDEYGNNFIAGNFATDSLLGYHLDFGIKVNGHSSLFMGSNPVNFGFYTNDMTNAVMSNCLVSMMKPLAGEGYVPYYMPFDFSRDAAGRVQLKVKDGSDGVAATIIDGDIPTLMGPIHVVDHFLMPKGFKLN